MITTFRKNLAYGLAPLILAACYQNMALAQGETQTTVFKIGEFNRSSIEFSSETPKEKVNYIVSGSDPAKDWFAYQAAVLSAKIKEASIAAAPRAITFALEGRPAGNYRLHVAFLIENASVPALKVGINGKEGIFYLHPRLDYSNGDQFDSFDPAYSSADVDFTFPGSYLRNGSNTLSLQAIEEAEEAEPNAGINYDAIELDSLPKSAASRAFSAQLVPTVFFRQQNNELLETVDAFIRYSGKIAPGSEAELTIGKRSYPAQLRGGYDFGEDKVEFAVHEFEPNTEAQLTVETGGHKQRYKQSIDPARKWNVFLVPHIHLDVGYSDYQAKVAAIQSRAIDEALDMIQKNPEFRFSLDGEWPLQQFLETRNDAEQQRTIETIRKKQLFLPANYANLLTGTSSTEALLRSLYPSADFSSRYNTPFDYASITDVPSYSWSYASILASARIHYLVAAADNYRAPVFMQSQLNEKSPMWWVGPDGKKVLLWYSRSYLHLQMLFGLPPIVAAGHDTLPLYLQAYEKPSYHANSTILYGTQQENSDLFPQQAELAQRWNAIYAYPHLKNSGFVEALQDIEKQFGDHIPTIRGDGGPYWEDGAASDAYYLAMERWSEARALTAEKLATLVPLADPLLKTDMNELNRMWTDIVLTDEHTYDSWNSVSTPKSKEAVEQLALKEQFAVNAAAEVDFTIKRNLADLADAIPTGTDSLIVFNSLNWKRSGPVTVDLDKGQEIVDAASNQPVPVEIIASSESNTDLGLVGFNRESFIARDVPAVGYKVYIIRPAQNIASAPSAAEITTLESPYYKVQLDPETGAIRSIFDKQLQKELVSQEGSYRFGEYLYVTGGDKVPNRIIQDVPVFPKPELEVHPSRNGRIVSVTRTPDGIVARMESESVNTPLIKTEIRLFDIEKKIELAIDLDKKEVASREAAYFAFPFAMSHPQFQYEVQNGVVDPAQDMYPGAGHEWFSVQHWVSVQQDGLSGTLIPLDSPLVTLGDIDRGSWPDEFGERPGTVFSYVMNNYWNTNYSAGQGGHFSFHYAVTSASATDDANLSRLGWEEMTPLETDFVTVQDKAVNLSSQGQSSAPPLPPGTPVVTHSAISLDGKEDSFLEVSDANVLLETWKPAEDGNGTILRFLDFGGTERTVTVRTKYLHLDHVWLTDAVERGQTAVPLVGDNEFHFIVHPHEIVTLRVTEQRK
jgi:hypothetical protein